MGFGCTHNEVLAVLPARVALPRLPEFSRALYVNRSYNFLNNGKLSRSGGRVVLGTRDHIHVNRAQRVHLIFLPALF